MTTRQHHLRPGDLLYRLGCLAFRCFDGVRSLLLFDLADSRATLTAKLADEGAEFTLI
jgi:hypothetical protein